MKTALVIEDLPATSDWLAQVLESAFPSIHVRRAYSVSEALERLQHERPDLALVDLGLPDGSGIRVLEAIAKIATTTAVVTTTFGDDEHVFPALKAGAQGYLLKDASRAELAMQLTGIAQGRPPLSPGIAQKMLRHFSGVQAIVNETHDAPASLTPRETETLELISKGYTVAKVGDAMGVSYHTAAGYVKAIYRKLNVSSRAEAALQATRLGLVN